MKIFSYIRSHVVLSSGIAIVIVISMIIAGRVAQRNKIVDVNQSNTKKVSLINVEDFRNNKTEISADGIVESVSQADLKSQIGAPLLSVNVSIGDTVSVGQTIAVLQNADIKAQLDQARAGLELAKGQYIGTGITLESVKGSALETLNTSYSAAGQIVNSDIDQFLYKSFNGSPNLSAYISDSKLNNSIRDFYLGFRNTQNDWRRSLDMITIASKDEDILKSINISKKNFQSILIFLDQISKAINDAGIYPQGNGISEVFNSWQAIVTQDRVLANTNLKNLISIESSLSNANISYGSIANAQISAAQAMVKNLEAQFTKTVITSPINGKIAALPFRVGELIQPGQLIATVVGGGGLRIKGYISGDDLSRISVGAKAKIEDGIVGTVVNISPSVNQINKKAEVKISIDDVDVKNLVVGESVSILISSNNIMDKTDNAENNIYLLPIQNIKIVPGAAYVFTIDGSSRVVKNSVIIGKIEGDFVQIISGINPEMKIVTPVYELEEGQTVVVQ